MIQRNGVDSESLRKKNNDVEPPVVAAEYVKTFIGNGKLYELTC